MRTTDLDAKTGPIWCLWNIAKHIAAVGVMGYTALNVFRWRRKSGSDVLHGVKVIGTIFIFRVEDDGRQGVCEGHIQRLLARHQALGGTEVRNAHASVRRASLLEPLWLVDHVGDLMGDKSVRVVRSDQFHRFADDVLGHHQYLALAGCREVPICERQRVSKLLMQQIDLSPLRGQRF